MNCLARAKNGNRAYAWLCGILTQCTFPNLWDAYQAEEGARLFQIDGNLGATAGIAEMLLQSHEGYLHVLPALPDAWESGSFEGLTARGGFAVSASWEHRRVTALSVTASVDGVLKLRIGEDNAITERPVKAGDTYRII
jgi:alpha-L-fucosidase 2